MVIFLLIVKIFFITLGVLATLLYLLFQFYQKVPKEKFKTNTIDIVVLTGVSLIFGFAFDSYYGLLSFVPLLAIKWFCWRQFQPSRVKRRGFWVEVSWKRFPMKGFQGVLPPAALAELERMPKSTHFMIPRLFFVVALRFVRKRFAKDAKKAAPAAALPKGYSKQQQQAASDEMGQLMENLLTLPQGTTRGRDFPFGSLKVTRL
jgi:hypothetical protein